MDEKLLEYLIEKLESVSPELWAMAQRQVLINNFLNTIYALGSFNILVWVFVSWKKLLKGELDLPEWIEDLLPLFIFGSVILFVFSVFVFLASSQYLIYGILNPDFLALKELLGLVKAQ